MGRAHPLPCRLAEGTGWDRPWPWPWRVEGVEIAVGLALVRWRWRGRGLPSLLGSLLGRSRQGWLLLNRGPEVTCHRLFAAAKKERPGSDHRAVLWPRPPRILGTAGAHVPTFVFRTVIPHLQAHFTLFKESKNWRGNRFNKTTNKKPSERGGRGCSLPSTRGLWGPPPHCK